MSSKLELPPNPRSNMFEANGTMSRVWQSFFLKLFERTGGYEELTNTELAAIIGFAGLTANRILATDGDKTFTSVANLTAWINDTTDQIVATDNGDGTLTLSTPQDIATDSAVVFGSIEATYHYIGDANTNGSWRFTKDGDDLKLQVRKAGIWTDTSSWIFADY